MSLDFDAVVIGAGFGGMYMLHRLRGMGFSVRVFEAGKGVGGTWYWNRYPGARCDVESVQYSYQFSPELQQEWEWTERYATQPEILRYANHVADRFDLRRDIQFETRVTKATFDETATTPGRSRPTRATASPPASSSRRWAACRRPTRRRFPGLADFKGPTYHTGNWPHEGVDFTGKTVGVIGTGSSAIQSIPIIAQQAEPPHRVPAHRQLHHAGAQPAARSGLRARRSRRTTAAMRKRRQDAAGRHRLRDQHGLGDRDARRTSAGASSRSAGTMAAWASWRSFSDLLLNDESNKTAAEFVRAKIRDDRQGSRDRRSADADEHHRLQAAVRRHRLLGDLQPAATSRWSTSATSRSSASRRPACAPRARTTRSTAWCWRPASTP